MSNTSRGKIEDFFLKANSFHPMIKFRTEISETETAFLDTKVYKGDRFNKEAILDVRTHFKPTVTFQYTNFYLCHPPCVTKGFNKGEALPIAACVAGVRRRGKWFKKRAREARKGRGPIPSSFPLYSSSPFDPFPPILRPATQATLLRTNSSQFNLRKT